MTSSSQITNQHSPAHGERPLRVLLLSPVRELDPPNGDVTYTEQLLAEPPSNVIYTPYNEAFDDGRLVDLSRWPPRTGHRGKATAFAVVVREAIINRLRRRQLLFRETFRHYAVQPSAFDLVHSHTFAVRLYADDALPLVVSNASEIDALYRDGFQHSRMATWAWRGADRLLARATGVTHASYDHRGAARVICFSEDLRERFLEKSSNPASRYVVVPPAVTVLPQRSEPAGMPFTIGFIGEWEIKGGEIVLAAHRRLRSQGVDSRLLVVGSEPRLSARESEQLKVEWLPRQPRATLLERILPRMTVFAYPSRCDGVPLTLLEVMSAGIPVVVSDYRALPEVVENGGAGLVAPVDDQEAFASALSALVDPETRRTVGSAGRARVLNYYVSAHTRPALHRAYREALDQHPVRLKA